MARPLAGNRAASELIEAFGLSRRKLIDRGDNDTAFQDFNGIAIDGPLNLGLEDSVGKISGDLGLKARQLAGNGAASELIAAFGLSRGELIDRGDNDTAFQD